MNRSCAAWVAALGLVVAIVVPAGATSIAVGSPAVRYVDVSVATMWASPSAPRAIDRPALANPVQLTAWSQVLTTDARLGLVGRIETQALLGEPVLVLGTRGAWTHVAVPDQSSPKNRLGYPGWVPSRQLTSSASFGPLLTGRIAIVTSPSAWLRSVAGTLRLSFGTRLPVVASSGADVTVATPGGGTGRLSRSSVAVYTSTQTIPVPSGSELVATSREFLGVRYLWGGTSAFGFDCSGLMSLIYRTHGMLIPRDADAQALLGRFVPRAAMRPGDLLFFATDPPSREITHVSMYIGRGLMIESPDSAGAVHIIPVSALGSEYVTARRYLAVG